jgi:hypothetical protein
MQSSSQQATTQNSDAQQQPHAVAQKESSNDTKQSKTALNDANMAWQDVTSGAAGIVTAGLALFSSSEQKPFVESTNYKGSIQDNIQGDKVTTVEGKLTDSFLGGADSFTKGSASDTVLGMAGDTIIGLSSDALIGLAMPFTLISMGQVLLNMDEDVCVVESKSFKLDIAGLKITTPGGAVWGGKATEEAAKLEKAEQLLGDAKKAEDAVKDAQKTKDAADVIKAEKTAADAKALKTGEDFEKQAKATEDLKNTTAAERAQKFEKLGKFPYFFEICRFKLL